MIDNTVFSNSLTIKYFDYQTIFIFQSPNRSFTHLSYHQAISKISPITQNPYFISIFAKMQPTHISLK